MADSDVYGMELCLEFANTVHWHASDQPMETLCNYTDIVTWVQRAGKLTTAQAERLKEEAAQHPIQAGRVFERGIVLREVIYQICVTHIQQQAPVDDDLEQLNTELGKALAHAQLEPIKKGFEWNWNNDAQPLDRVLWPIARSAAELLTSGQWLPRLGQCADDRGCGWLFIDTSKNHSRRWCDINDCGNRAKQRRHYLRNRPPTTDD